MRRKDLPKCQVYHKQGKKSFCRWRQTRKQGATGKQVGTDCFSTPASQTTCIPSQPVTLGWAVASQGSPACFRQPPEPTRPPPAVASQCHTTMEVFVGSPVTHLLCRLGDQLEETES